MSAMIRVQQDDFDAGAEISAIRETLAGKSGALVSFTGLMRDTNEGERVTGMQLEHYPGMTEKALADIERQARDRWQLDEVLIIHRVGALRPADQIVLVVTAAAHRRDAFAACEFIMDYLKTGAPLWKKETTASGERWVEARPEDGRARGRWQESGDGPSGD